MEIKTAKHSISQILKNNTNCYFETNLIFEHVLNVSTTQLLLTRQISYENFKKCKKIAKKRAANKPLQHLLKSWQFYNIEIKLNSKIFIPRPETELLVEFALKKFRNKPLRAVDLCAGSGCVSAAIAHNKKNAKIKAVDFSKQAAKYAKKNTIKFKNRVQIFCANVLNENFAKNFKNWADLIVCNPPYLNKNDMKNLQPELKFEPKMALHASENGLMFYKKICKLWKITLKNFGWIAFEIGYKQKNDVENILKDYGFINVKSFNDCFNNNRMVVAQKFKPTQTTNIKYYQI